MKKSGFDLQLGMPSNPSGHAPFSEGQIWKCFSNNDGVITVKIFKTSDYKGWGKIYHANLSSVGFPEASVDHVPLSFEALTKSELTFLKKFKISEKPPCGYSIWASDKEAGVYSISIQEIITLIRKTV